MKNELIMFCKMNEVELFNKLGIKYEDGMFYEDGMGVFGDEENDVEGVDVSLVEGVLVEDECNIIDKIEIGGRILFVNDYR
jgi:hypothetical protein